jgi:hypothetical protein
MLLLTVIVVLLTILYWGWLGLPLTHSSSVVFGFTTPSV